MSTSEVVLDRETVLSDLIGCIAKILGEDTVAILKVSGDTSIFIELGMTSLDLIQLLELIDEIYPASNALVGWIADQPSSALPHLTLGQAADVIYHVVG